MRESPYGKLRLKKGSEFRGMIFELIYGFGFVRPKTQTKKKAKSKTIMRAMGTMNIILRALSQHHLGENLQKEFHLTRG